MRGSAAAGARPEREGVPGEELAAEAGDRASILKDWGRRWAERRGDGVAASLWSVGITCGEPGLPEAWSWHGVPASRETAFMIPLGARQTRPDAYSLQMGQCTLSDQSRASLMPARVG